MRCMGFCLLLVVGCVSDPVGGGDAGPKEGKLDGACHDNGTCDDGLVCVAGLKRCAPPGDAASSDSGTGDSGSDAAGDAAADANPCTIPAGGGVKCPNAGTCAPGTNVCCMKSNNGACSNDTGCMSLMPVDFIWRCDRKADCAFNNGACCVDNAVFMNGGICPLFVSSSMSKGSFCTMNAPCTNNGTNVMLCSDDAECTGSQFGSKCAPTQFAGGGTMKVVGICRN